jgi:AraC family ethanolamine operon transcriptional activator
MTITPQSNGASSSPHCQVVSRRLHDFSGFSEIFARWNGQFHQMSRGKFEGAVHVANGQVVRLFQAEMNQAILTRGMDNEFATFIPITVHNASTRWSGRRLSPGTLIAKLPEAEYNNQTIPNATIRGLLVPVGTIQEMTRTLTGQRMNLELPTWSAPHPPPRILERFERGLATLLTAAIHTPTILGGAEGRALELECLRRLIDVLVEPSATLPASMCAKDRKTLVRRAVDVMHDRLNEPLTAVDLCAELHTSDRSLRRAFREAFGLGPLAYFRVIRLHAARAALSRARESEESVAQIARRFGFHRLGSFSNEYRRQFGEFPSHTHRMRGRKKPCGQETRTSLWTEEI